MHKSEAPGVTLAMAADLPRPDLRPALGKGLLLAEHFQVAYATNDIDQACSLFRDRFGIGRYARLEGTLPAGGSIRVELAWVGTVMIELMTASGAGSAIYMDRLPQGEGFALRHHHLGYLVADAAEWDGLIAKAADCGFAVPHQNDNVGFMRTCFVDATPLGHYLEYILPEPAGLEFFRSVPAS